VNDRAVEINGLPKEAHIGKRPGEILPDVGPQMEEYLKKVRNTGKPLLRIQLTGNTPASPGEERQWIVSYYPVRSPKGIVFGIGVIALEVTDQKRAEQALRDAHEQLASRALHLERLVQQRTARLNEMIGDLEGFSYSIVHDMRGPLRAMNSFTQLLQEECGQVSPIAENYMKRIRTATVRMDRLIQDGLNYSRLMRAELPLVPVDVAVLVRGILETYPTLQPPNAAIELCGEFPLVKANEATLTQCVSNLLGNAVKFVAPGVSPKVRVWAETCGDRVRVFFKDNGIGIPIGAHERIFQIFQRLDNTYDGTGIGLAIVKKAAERMGCSVGVESELDKGSTFWLELARAEMEPTPGAPKQT
jgi:signal transduction histidine kinase